MRLKLYVVHGSHPCAAVEKALALKHLDYRVFEWPPPAHTIGQRIVFGRRTVPGLKIGAEKVQGSRAIMRRLDELVPDPPLFPQDPAARARVEEAERWGDEIFQPVARELIWAGFLTHPSAMVSYSTHSKLPLPAPAVRAVAPVIVPIQARINRTDAATAARVLAALPAQLDQIDAYIADGTIGDAAQPNAADLQILSTIGLLLTIADVRPLIDSRPCGAAAQALFGGIFDGDMPPARCRPSRPERPPRNPHPPAVATRAADRPAGPSCPLTPSAASASASRSRPPSGAGSVIAGSSSSSGTRTNRRDRTSGCGSVSRSDTNSRSPSSSTSTSITRGPWRTPPAARPTTRSTALHASSRAAGSSDVRTRTQALRNDGWSSTSPTGSVS